MSFGNFLRLINSARDFLGVNFWSMDFWGFVASPQVFWGVFDLLNITTFP